MKRRQFLMKIAGKETWNEQEIMILRQFYMLPVDQLATLLPNRTARSIRIKARRLGLSLMWRPEEDAVIRAHYGKSMPGQIAKLLVGRSERAVKTRASRLGLGGSY